MTDISRMCFTLLLLTSFCQVSRDTKQTDTEEVFKTPRDKTVQTDFSGSKLPWNCTYKVNSTSHFHFSRGRVTKAMLDNGRLFSVHVQYKLYGQDDRETEYSNQAFFRSIVNGTKRWRVRLIKPKKEGVLGIVENVLMDSVALLDFTLVQFSIEASCTFQFTSNSNTSSKLTRNSDLAPDYFKQKILHIARLGGKMCDGEDETCFMITDFKQSPITLLLWAAVSSCIYLFIYIGPAIVCLFPATEVTSTISSTLASASTVKDKESQIIVAWQSPIGFRSLIGNCFFRADDTMWNRIKRFIMRVLILPVPFFLPAIFVEYLHHIYIWPRHNSFNFGIFPSFKLNVLCYSCYCIHAFLCSFMIRNPSKQGLEDTDRLRKFLLICDPPLQMLSHFRTFWPQLKLEDIMDKEVRRVFCNILSRLMLLLPYIFCIMLFTSPIAVICSTQYFTFLMVPDKNSKTATPYNVARVVFYFPAFFISWFAAYGGITLLRSAGLGVLLLLQLAVKITFCEEIILFTISFVFLSYYLWSSYRSFTNRYKKLALVLSELLRKVEIDDHDSYRTRYHYYRYKLKTRENNLLVKRIPKKLFEESCEKLLPIKPNLYKLIWKTVLYLTYFCAILFITKMVDITPSSKTLVVFMSGSVPKIMTCFFGKRNPKKTDDLTQKAGHLASYTSTMIHRILHFMRNNRTRSDYDIFRSLLLDPEKTFEYVGFSSLFISLTIAFVTIDWATGYVYFSMFFLALLQVYPLK